MGWVTRRIKSMKKCLIQAERPNRHLCHLVNDTTPIQPTHFDALPNSNNTKLTALLERAQLHFHYRLTPLEIETAL